MKSFISILISFHLVFAHPAFALDVEIKSALNLRSDGLGRSDSLKRLTVKRTLPAGTVLRIPDGYLVDKNGIPTNDPKNADHQRTLLKWLESNTSIPTKENYQNLKTGSLDIETFFPVTVVSLPFSHKDKSDFTKLIGTTGLMALGVLARKKTNGLELTNTEATELNIESANESEKVSSVTNTEAEVCTTGCKSTNPEPQPSSLFENLNNDLEKILVELDKNAKNKVDKKPLDAVMRNFNKNCYGIQFDDFKDFIIKKAKDKNVPAEIMLGIMTQETALKNCQSISLEKNDKGEVVSKNVGLFQINTKTRGMRECSADELTQLSAFKNDLASMETQGPKCLNNPAINASFGFDVLIEKYKIVNKEAPPAYDGKSWTNQTTDYKDKYRRAVSAYNGGQTWIIGGKTNKGSTVVGADRELEIAASIFTPPLTSVQLKSWKYTRLMVFHRQLEDQTDVFEKYGLNHGKNAQRSRENNMNNMSYVDAVTGTDPPSPNYIDFATQWSKELYLVRK